MEAEIVQGNAPHAGKLVSIKAAGGGHTSSAFITPGTTAADILTRLGLTNEFQISRGTPDSVFGHDEPVYGQIRDGDLLFVTSRVDAGRV